MGQSTPTTTMALDNFVARYAAYRAELHPREQVWFDELVCRARRHSNAINRRPHLDFERPVVLSMMLEGMKELEEAQAEITALRARLTEVVQVLEEHGMALRRLPAATPLELGRVGQTRLSDLDEAVTA